MTRQPQTPDLAVMKARQQQAWASVDYGDLATTMVIMSELLCEAVDLRAGWRVLDVATGSGNTAIAAARRFCDVTGIDYVPALLERGRERAAAERLPVTFREGDAEDLPFPDASFDAVLSTIGAMFAPDQEKTARELLRVCRSGGRIGMANWDPNGLTGEIGRVTARYIPPPVGMGPPRWGTEEGLRELFGDEVTSLQVTRRSVIWRYRSPEHWLEFFRAHHGQIHRNFASLDPAQQEALAGDLLDVVRRFNRSGDETLVAPADYLEVAAIRK